MCLSGVGVGTRRLSRTHPALKPPAHTRSHTHTHTHRDTRVSEVQAEPQACAVRAMSVPQAAAREEGGGGRGRGRGGRRKRGRWGRAQKRWIGGDVQQTASQAFRSPVGGGQGSGRGALRGEGERTRERKKASRSGQRKKRKETLKRGGEWGGSVEYRLRRQTCKHRCQAKAQNTCVAVKVGEYEEEDEVDVGGGAEGSCCWRAGWTLVEVRRGQGERGGRSV